MNSLHLNAFTKSYQNHTVLSFPGLTLESGKIHAIIGPNGSGKSTFARVVSGMEKSDSRCDAITDFSGRIGYLPQKPYAFHTTLEKNLLHNGPRQREKAISLMEALSLTGLRKKNAAALSGGETARMALARLFMQTYDLVFLDEPCASMDIHSTYQAEELIRMYNKEHHATIFLITHSLKQAERISDTVLFFKDGNLMEYGPTRQVLHHPSRTETAEFLDF